MTGAAQGIEENIVPHLLEANARVIATNVNMDGLKNNMFPLIRSYPEKLMCKSLDLENTQQVITGMLISRTFSYAH